MLILTLRTDKPEAELGLFDDTKQLAYETWPAHRKLAETIHSKIATLLQDKGNSLSDIQGVVAYHGPGSFTGLRIGLSVANALASSYSLKIVGITGDDWVQEGTRQLLSGQGGTVALPEYGAPVHVTTPKH